MSRVPRRNTVRRWSLHFFLGAILLAFASDALLAQPRRGGPNAPGAPRDGLGRPVLDSAGGRLRYATAPPRPAPDSATATLRPPSWQSEAGSQIAVTLDWYRAVFGTGIGWAGLVAADLDGDGSQELVASASAGGFGSNIYWYVLSAGNGEYRQRWTSLPFAASIDRLVVAQIDDDAALEVLLAASGNLIAYDGATLEPELAIAIPATGIYGLATGEVDGDAGLEAVFCNQSGTWIYDLETGLEQLALPGESCDDLALGETDGTAGLELVVAYGATGRVLDAATGALEWDHPLGFGDEVALGDFDGDGLDEIAAGFAWSGIQVWHGDTHGFLWEVQVFNLATLAALDVEGNGSVELVYGDAQWGDVHVLEGSSGNELWWVANPEHGVTRIALGDLDEDGSREIFFGAGYTSTGEDHLYVVDTVTHAFEWESTDISGPFLGLAHGDVDADGSPELVYTSFQSDSGYGDGLYFIHDAVTFDLEFQSPEPTGSNWTGLWKVQLENVDADSALEILLPTSNTYSGELQCRDGETHALQWNADLVSGLTFASLRVADPDGDGQLDLASGTVVEHTGAPGPRTQLHDAGSGLAGWQSPNLESFFGFFATLGLLRVADIDSDGHGEILVAERGGGLMALDPVGGTIDLAAAGAQATALEVADLDGDGVEEIVVGTSAGMIEKLDTVTGAPTPLAGPYPGDIDGLAVVQVVGSSAHDFVFSSADQIHVVDGATLQTVWLSGDLGSAVGWSDSLLVADVDGDGEQEIWVNTGAIGHMLFSIQSLLFADGFESGDTSAWSSTIP